MEYVPLALVGYAVLIERQEFGTHAPLIRTYHAAVQDTDPAVSVPLVETVPFVQANVCEYVWLPPDTAELAFVETVVA